MNQPDRTNVVNQRTPVSQANPSTQPGSPRQQSSTGRRIVRGIFAVLSIFFALFFRNRTTVLGLLLCVAGVIALFTDPPYFFLTGVGLLALGLAMAGWGYWSTRGR